jgi:hypothetical protein
MKTVSAQAMIHAVATMTSRGSERLDRLVLGRLLVEGHREVWRAEHSIGRAPDLVLGDARAQGGSQRTVAASQTDALARSVASSSSSIWTIDFSASLTFLESQSGH